MYLEKLEINGFKSFANKNKLIFSGLIDDQKRGLTAIVGPNGSGKSNVADAIRWALGEQSLKILRGKKSEDIIFSGSDKKAKLGSAEVSLHLNNQQKTLIKASDQNFEEKNNEVDSNLNKILNTCDHVIITRRIFRNGESEYLLNNSRVRLADIQMLLAKASFGQKTYSVIGQGMVENFLTVSANERKDFFDEATGIKQFQIKRDSSLNKLESSYENLRQVDMLLSEIKPRLKSLTRQVDKLKKREGVEVELQSDQLLYYGHLWHDINKKLKQNNQDILILEKEGKEKKFRLEKLNEELTKIQLTDGFKEINQLEPQLREKEEQKNQALKELNKIQIELETKLEAQGKFDLSWLNNKKSELAREVENIDLEIENLIQLFPKKEEGINRQELEDLNKSLAENKKIILKKEELEKQKFLMENKISRLEVIIEANLEAKKNVDLALLKNREKNLQEEKSDIEAELTKTKEEKSDEQKIFLSKEISKIDLDLKNLNIDLNRINQTLKENEGKLEGKKEIERIVDEFLAKLEEINKESNLEIVKKLIAEAKDNFGNKIKTLISGEDQKFLEEIKAIQEKIISLSEKKQKLNTQLIEEGYRLNNLEQKTSNLSEKLKEKELLLTSIKLEVERAKEILNFSGIEEEKGEAEKKKKAIELEIKNIQDDDKEQDLLAKKYQIEQALQALFIKTSSLNERLRLLKEKKVDLNEELKSIISKIEKSGTKFDAERIKEEEGEINKKISNLNKEIAVIKKQFDFLKEKREKEKSLMFEIQKNSQLKQQELNLLQENLGKIQTEAARQETRLEDLESNIRNENLSLLAIEDFIVDENASIEMLPKKINSLKTQLEQIGGIDPEVENEFKETKERYDFLKTQTDDLEKTIDSLEEIILELDKTIKIKFDHEFKIISEKFSEYFKILFNGGEAKISKLINEGNKDEKNEETDNNIESSTSKLEEDKIKTEFDKKLRKIKELRKYGSGDLEGIDIQAVPPGKKIQTVTMLSGGERALTAIALICAIINANPSPFVVLDEVDAALDESNSERLAKILDDLSNKTQFIVITHNRASMKKASILYGVTMQADGVSQLLSVKLDNLEKV